MTQNYDRSLNAWLGWRKDSLATSSGAPNRTARLSNGSVIWEYAYRSEEQRGGDTSYTYKEVKATETITDADGKTTTIERTKTISEAHKDRAIDPLHA